ncbi:MAG TPA: CAP domain-containing protein [Rhodobacteraceae bacterium]|nr:CAP domain-containing protein [Paracoccaceae bacterium]
MKKPYLLIIGFLFSTIVAAGFSPVQAAGCALPENATQLAEQAENLINQQRARKGRKPLRIDPRLQAAAQAHACDMAVKGYFSHTSPGGSGPKRRVQRQACRSGFVAENIAVGQTSAEGVMNSWMSSSGHRKNILVGKGVDRFGLAVVKAGKAYGHGYAWVLVLARGC